MFIIHDIAMVVAAALLGGLLFWRLRQPPILGYVLAGLLVSPLTPGPRVSDVHAFEVMAEIGVVLLMFSVGIEFSIPDLLRVKWVALIGAPIGISLSIGLGLGAGLLCGWPLLQGIAVGCIISVASTMVMMRLLMDCGEMASQAGRIMITLTLIEDITVVLLTILLPSLGSDHISYGQLLWRLGKAVLLLAPMIAAGCMIIPRLLARVEKTGSDEIAVLLGLTICLVIATITEAVGLSLALGAFIGGLLVGGSDDAHKFAQRMFPIRDAFVALFFVTVGMLIDPQTWFTGWRLVLLIVGLVVAGKFAVWFGIVRAFRYPAKTAVRVGVGLTQIGEFSFVLAQVSLQAHLISAAMYHAVLAASLITILINATLFKVLRRIPLGSRMPINSGAVQGAIPVSGG
jgi:CPA2 family monovalent cation:H+ antiporter-2